MIELYLSKVTENSESEQAGKLYARVSYKQAMNIYGYQPLQALQIIDKDSLTDEQLFQHIHDVIVRERLFLDPSFGRQTIIDSLFVLAYITFLFAKVRNNYLFLHFLPYKYSILPVHVFIGHYPGCRYARRPSCQP